MVENLVPLIERDFDYFLSCMVYAFLATCFVCVVSTMIESWKNHEKRQKSY